jgi:putative peptide zinc metalloprotease protein
LLFPISSKSSYPCYLDSAKKQKLTVPLQTSIDKVFVQEGSRVNQGDLLFTLDSARLKHTLMQKEVQKAILEKELGFFLLDDRLKEKAEGKKIELVQLETEIHRIKRDFLIAHEGIIAPFSGTITKLDFRLQKGFSAGEGVIVGELESENQYLVQALVTEKEIQNIAKEQHGMIYFNTGTDSNFGGVITDFKLFSERDLKDLPFSSRHGGELATETKGDGDIEEPLHAQFQCSISLKNIPERVPFGMTGRLIVNASPQSTMSRIIQSVSGAFNRESLL